MKYALLAILLVASAAGATNKPNPPQTSGDNEFHNEANSNANGYGGDGGNGIGVGVGIGLGQGGQGGEGGKGGSGGVGYGGVGIGGDSSSAVKDSGNSANFNANTAKGGNASQGQAQSQKTVTQMALENSNRINASSSNANNSQATGNTTVTNVGGDSTLVERNAPPVFLGAITPTSCGGSIQAGASDRNGSGAFGVSWVGKECSKRLVADRFQQYGQVDVACRIMKTTKAFKAAVKDDPSLANIDCAMKQAPAPAPVMVAPELAPRIPRG